MSDALNDEPAARVLVPLLVPRDGIPPVVASADELDEVVAAFSAGEGPVAVDAERASGYRYGQRAYLVQIRRAGAGTALIDPIACPELYRLGDAIAGADWVLHAAPQDLPCLAEVGLRPRRIFDTELAGRLAGFSRVGLASIVQSVLGFSLEKDHSAVDWSTRPLPEPWLKYAALDVEVLVELRAVLEEELRRQGKLGWACEEFAAIVSNPPARPRSNPWRRTSGVHRVRTPRQLAVVQMLWETRDRVARERDLSPGRVLPDTAIIDAALAMPETPEDLAALRVFGGRSTRRSLQTWFGAVRNARALPDHELPSPSPAVPHDGPPPARSWSDRDPAAAERLAAARGAVTAIADEHGLPTENLLSPDAVRRLTWEPPVPLTTDSIGAVLRRHGAREWQVCLTAAALADALGRLPARTE